MYIYIYAHHPQKLAFASRNSTVSSCTLWRWWMWWHFVRRWPGVECQWKACHETSCDLDWRWKTCRKTTENWKNFRLAGSITFFCGRNCWSVLSPICTLCWSCAFGLPPRKLKERCENVIPLMGETVLAACGGACKDPDNQWIWILLQPFSILMARSIL